MTWCCSTKSLVLHGIPFSCTSSDPSQTASGEKNLNPPLSRVLFPSCVMEFQHVGNTKCSNRAGGAPQGAGTAGGMKNQLILTVPSWIWLSCSNQSPWPIERFPFLGFTSLMWRKSLASKEMAVLGTGTSSSRAPQ